ncbi:slightly ste11-like protein [Lecanora helva]
MSPPQHASTPDLSPLALRAPWQAVSHGSDPGTPSLTNGSTLEEAESDGGLSRSESAPETYHNVSLFASAGSRFYTPGVLFRPPILYRLDILGQYLKPRLANAPDFKVIAVDGLDKNAVHLVIATLHHCITQDLGCTVRVVGEQIPLNVSTVPTPTALDRLNEQVHYWNGMWDMMIDDIPSGLNNHGLPGYLHPSLLTYSHPCIYILPLSPFIATLKASIGMELVGVDGDLTLWRWLASHWAGRLGPDITVNIQETSDIVLDHEVLRIEGESMKTIIVTKARNGGIDITPSQIRRVSFEVKEWLGTMM